MKGPCRTLFVDTQVKLKTGTSGSSFTGQAASTPKHHSLLFQSLIKICDLVNA
jgi:hypothetical protein